LDKIAHVGVSFGHEIIFEEFQLIMW